MAVSHVGKAVVWGVAGNTMTKDNAGTTVSGIIFSSSDASSDAKEVMHADGVTGGTIGVTFYDTGKTVTVECYVTGTSKADAITNKGLLPVKGTKVVITGVTGDTSDSLAGTYLCMSASQRRSNTDKMVVSLTLPAWDELASYTAIAG